MKLRILTEQTGVAVIPRLTFSWFHVHIWAETIGLLNTEVFLGAYRPFPSKSFSNSHLFFILTFDAKYSEMTAAS